MFEVLRDTKLNPGSYLVLSLSDFIVGGWAIFIKNSSDPSNSNLIFHFSLPLSEVASSEHLTDFDFIDATGNPWGLCGGTHDVGENRGVGSRCVKRWDLKMIGMIEDPMLLYRVLSSSNIVLW